MFPSAIVYFRYKVMSFKNGLAILLFLLISGFKIYGQSGDTVFYRVTNNDSVFSSFIKFKWNKPLPLHQDSITYYPSRVKFTPCIPNRQHLHCIRNFNFREQIWLY